MDEILCPEHQTPMHHWTRGDLYACRQDPACRYAGGFTSGELFPLPAIGSGLRSITLRDKEGPMKIWNGRAVHAEQTLGGIVTGKPVKLMMPEASARKLALCIRRLTNTTSLVPPEVEEIADAIDFVLVGDPGSFAKHRRMEAGKGMEPAGGDPSSYAKEETDGA